MRFRLPCGRRTRVVLLCLAGVLLAFGLRPALVNYRLFRARTALELRETDEALAELRSIERLDPEHPEAEFLLARTFRRLGRFDKVRKHLARAARLGWPAEQIRREEWLALAQAGQLSEVEHHLPQLLRDPRGDGPAICEAFVDGYFATYQFGLAFQLLEGWEKDYPDDPQPHIFRGLFLEHASAWADAAPAYRKALELAPFRTDARLRLARLLMRLQEYHEAAAHFQRCLHEEPHNADVLVGWGQCLLRRGMPDEALGNFRRALELDPKHFDARLAMGQAEQANGRTREARRWLESACRERPYDTEARYALAKTLQAAGDAKAARDHFQFVAEARDALADLQTLMERIRTNPDDHATRYTIGAALLRYDDPAHGAAWLRSVLEIRPDHRPTHDLLAAYYAERGNHDLAQHHRRQAEQPEDRS